MRLVGVGGGGGGEGGEGGSRGGERCHRRWCGWEEVWRQADQGHVEVDMAPATLTHTYTRTHARTHARARAHTHTQMHTQTRDSSRVTRYMRLLIGLVYDRSWSGMSTAPIGSGGFPAPSSSCKHTWSSQLQQSFQQIAAFPPKPETRNPKPETRNPKP